MAREDNFNMEIVREAVRPEKPSEQAIKEARRRRIKARRERERAAAKQAASGKHPVDNTVMGPKLAPNGQPVLPTRPARKAPVTEGSKHKTKVKDAPPPPPKTSLVGRIFGNSRKKEAD